MDAWSELDKRYGLNAASAPDGVDPWAELDKKHFGKPDPANQEVQQKAPKRVAGNPLMADVLSMFNIATQQGKDLTLGALRGAGSLGSTLVELAKTGPTQLGAKSIQSLPTRATNRGDAITSATSDLGANTDSFMYGAGKLGSEIAGTAGIGGALAKAVPASLPSLASAIGSSGMNAGGLTGLQSILPRVAGGAIVGGASAGLIDPKDALSGAAVGGALPVVLMGAGKVGSLLGSAIRPSVSNPQLADKAINQYGIPLAASDISSSGMIKGARSALDDSFLIGGMGRKQSEAVQQAYNKAIGETFGAGSPKLTPDVVDQAKSRMGSEFNRLWNNNKLSVDTTFIGDLQSIKQRAMDSLNPEQVSQIDKTIGNLMSKVDPVAREIDGSFANNWQSELRMVADGEKGLHKKLLGDLRQATLNAFNRSIDPKDAAALTMNRKQYRAFKTVEPILQKAEAGVGGRVVGDVPPALLPNAVMQNYGSGIAKSPFADLTQIGSQFIADRVPRTGGSARAAIQNTVLGGALTGGAMTNPALTAGLLGGALGLEGLLTSPRVAKAMLPTAAAPNQGLLDFQRWLTLSAPAIAASQ